MKNLIIVPILALFSLSTLGQEINITFTGTGESATVDSVIATNLTTNESIIVPGSETLILSTATGIDDILQIQNLSIYPNPFDGITTLSLCTEQACKTTISIVNLAGQEIARKSDQLQAGSHEFTISFKESGIYFINIVGNENKSIKVICNNPLGTNAINYSSHNTAMNKVKIIQQSEFVLAYIPGDWIMYEGYSNNYITVVTDSVKESKSINFEFVDCTDLDGETYKVVKIGEQYWMGENLAYLPKVYPGIFRSTETPYYYVNGYEDSIVNVAKSMSNYSFYGALYNFPAAIEVCPEGWHLPSKEEWFSLINFLGESPVVKLKDTGSSFWVTNETATNTSGFSAIPGGFKEGYWEGPWSRTFVSPGSEAIFWTSTSEPPDSIDETTSWYISMYAYNDELDISLYDICGHTIHLYSCTSHRNGFSVRCIKD